MDEPTAAISVRQVAEVLNLIRRLRDRGIAIVLISHRMPDVFSVADRVVVLRRGRKVADKADRGKLARGSHRVDHRRDRARLVTAACRRNIESLTMAFIVDDEVKRQGYPARLADRRVRPSGSSRGLRLLRLPVFATNSFATSNNLFNVTRNFTFVAVIALGMTIVIITGGIDLSVGSVLCLCSMILAVVMHAGYRIEVGIAASLGDRAGHRRHQRRADRLSRHSAIRGDARHAVDRAQPRDGRLQQHSGVPVRAGSRQAVFLGGGAWLFGISNPVIYMLVLALITGFVLRFTKFGRYVFAIGGNEHAAIVTGVPVRRTKVAVYMISALSAGIAGVIETGWLGAVTTNLGAGMELQVIAATVIGGANLAGGVGTAFGALIGSALIEVIRNSLGLLGISAFWQGTFVGSFIIVAVTFDRIRSFRFPQ